MKQTILVAAVVLFCSSVPLFGDNSHDCPMHSQNHADDLETRGARVMGFDQKITAHHFLLKTDGGLIRVTARDNDDTKSIAQIRSHLQLIAKEFSAGNFEKPHMIHLQHAPSFERLQQLKREIEYRYQEINGGAEVRIISSDQEAISAVHAFLRFQIEEHKTGDPID